MGGGEVNVGIGINDIPVIYIYYKISTGPDIVYIIPVFRPKSTEIVTQIYPRL